MPWLHDWRTAVDVFDAVATPIVFHYNIFYTKYFSVYPIVTPNFLSVLMDMYLDLIGRKIWSFHFLICLWDSQKDHCVSQCCLEWHKFLHTHYTLHNNIVQCLHGKKPRNKVNSAYRWLWWLWFDVVCNSSRRGVSWQLMCTIVTRWHASFEQ